MNLRSIRHADCPDQPWNLYTSTVYFGAPWRTEDQVACQCHSAMLTSSSGYTGSLRALHRRPRVAEATADALPYRRMLHPVSMCSNDCEHGSTAQGFEVYLTFTRFLAMAAYTCRMTSATLIGFTTAVPTETKGPRAALPQSLPGLPRDPAKLIDAGQCHGEGISYLSVNFTFKTVGSFSVWQ